LKTSGAVPPFKEEFRPQGRTCFIDQEAVRLRSQGGPSSQSLPQPLNPRVIVIRVDFSDLSMGLTKSETETFFDLVQDFYVENSYGVFVPSFTVTNIVHRLGSLATYGADCGADIACRDIVLRQEAIAAENNSGRDFSEFDQVMIYHAGNGQESSGSGNDIWSVFFPGGFLVDGQIFNGFTIVPEREALNVNALGVICHEYGHQLGLPDLYDTSVAGGRSTVGSWDVMDYPYTAAPGGQAGANPSHFGAWSKKFLGFANPNQLIDTSANSLVSANVSSSSSQIPLFASDVGPTNEFFLLEYRNALSTATFDKGIPGSGLLIWHIDETVASDPTRLEQNDVNSPSLNGAGHRGVELIEADFTENYRGGARGDAGDAFTSASTFLTPQSDAFNGAASGLVLTGIQGVGQTNLSFFLEFPALSTFTISNLVSFSTRVVTQEGYIEISIPAGAFPDQTSFYIAALSTSSISVIGSHSFAADFQNTNVGLMAGTQNNIQPILPISMTINFQSNAYLGSLSTEELEKIMVARYEPVYSSWVPLSSRVSWEDKSISCDLTHLSLFQMMQTETVQTLNQVKVFPNPLEPHRGPAHSELLISNVLPGASIKIFTVSGHLVNECEANSSGVALWNGRNMEGERVASGIYFGFIQKDKDKKVVKIAVEN
jgi:M6 family metalloprotease-like protein